jgi:hypothetical protein
MKQGKLRFFGAATILAFCIACLLDWVALLQVKNEMVSYADEIQYLKQEALVLLGNEQRKSPSHKERIEAIHETAEDRHIDVRIPPYSHEESFAGCILFLNQNPRLTEWIAYHYFALPLRTLIIAYDPRTTERATGLIERWKNVISIIEWNDEDYLPANWTVGLAPDLEKKTSLATMTHRKRQLMFSQKCHERSVEMGVKRTIIIDPDEYLRVNPKVVPATFVNTSEPGHVTKLFQQLEAPDNTMLVEQEGVTYKANCSVYPRVQFTTLGPSTLYRIPKDVEYLEAGLVDPFYFTTLRYRYRNARIMKHAKGLVYAMDETPHEITNLHYPLDLKCLKSAYSIDKSPLLVNHYIGSFEDFLHSFRSDARNDVLDFAKLRSRWEERSRGYGGTEAFYFHLRNPLVRDDHITSWIPAFFAWQSDEIARMLLRDTGARALNSNV